MDIKIKNILLKKINVPELCDIIIDFKNKDILDEHIKYWKLGPERFYNAIKKPYKIISYIYDDKEYVVNTDSHLDYYLYTNYSYQCWDLVLDLIKTDDKEWRKDDDKKYYILSNNINNNMIPYKEKYLNDLDID